LITTCGFKFPWTSFTSSALKALESRDLGRFSASRSAPACAAAAAGGHLGALQWLRARGCPWDAETCKDAEDFGHGAVLEWARANGCPAE